MACERCSSTPSISSGKCTVYVNVTINELFVELKEFVATKWKIVNSTCTHFEVKVNNFENFIFELNLLDFLSLKEASGINVLPVYEGEKLNFPTYVKTKTLDKWISLLMSRELIYILENNKLITHFQPIVDISDKSIYGYELLSRGVKRDGSIMSPFEMFKLAKESDLLFNLDRQARETSIINSAKEKIDKKLFINFLPTVIYNPEVCLKTTIDLIDKFGFKPENITFEVVETEDINDTNHLNRILDFYRKKGFKIALDDIGSGYSSLNNLSKFYPHYIKIDMAIIRDIHKNELQQEIFKALVSLSKKTDIKVLSEGVETKEELDFVVANGTDFVQGFYFGKPTEKPLKKIELFN